MSLLLLSYLVFLCLATAAIAYGIVREQPTVTPHATAHQILPSRTKLTGSRRLAA